MRVVTKKNELQEHFEELGIYLTSSDSEDGSDSDYNPPSDLKKDEVKTEQMKAATSLEECRAEVLKDSVQEGPKVAMIPVGVTDDNVVQSYFPFSCGEPDTEVALPRAQLYRAGGKKPKKFNLDFTESISDDFYFTWNHVWVLFYNAYRMFGVIHIARLCDKKMYSPDLRKKGLHKATLVDAAAEFCKLGLLRYIPRTLETETFMPTDAFLRQRPRTTQQVPEAPVPVTPLHNEIKFTVLEIGSSENRLRFKMIQEGGCQEFFISLKEILLHDPLTIKALLRAISNFEEQFANQQLTKVSTTPEPEAVHDPTLLEPVNKHNKRKQKEEFVEEINTKRHWRS